MKTEKGQHGIRLVVVIISSFDTCMPVCVLAIVFVHVCVWIQAEDVPLCLGEAAITSKQGRDSLFTENSFQK